MFIRKQDDIGPQSVEYAGATYARAGYGSGVSLCEQGADVWKLGREEDHGQTGEGFGEKVARVQQGIGAEGELTALDGDALRLQGHVARGQQFAQQAREQCCGGGAEQRGAQGYGACQAAVGAQATAEETA
ncbi:MAG: hypothetical protein FWF10_10090 [Clostridiales bacterium]|nr:hypothetical protein [Clostridiales bacterium]